jgi:hypothetical protein
VISKQKNNELLIRQATLNDIDDILRIDKEAYESVSEQVVASPSMMKERIQKSGPWFLIAESNSHILGYLSLMPTKKGPDEFISWNDSTDDGTLKNVYNIEGEYVYGVALTISRYSANLGVTDKLFLEAAKMVISENKKKIYFSGRMPGYYKHMNEFTAEDYYNKKVLKHGKNVAFDPQIRMYESFGLKKVRLVENGFVGDRESCNYSVIFSAGNPFYRFPFPKFWGSLIGLITNNAKLLKLIVR